MSDAKVIHRVIRRIVGWAVVSFFTEIRVIGGENVPEHGPIIVTATHHNMMLDPAVLSLAFPYRRLLHYWAKASLFSHPIMNYILTSAGNIPVDRKSNDRQKLFRGTFEALSKGLAVALFPEGTSYTEPRIMQVKDGAAWAALEYTKWTSENGHSGDPVMIVPAAIVYTNKSKYRSSVIMEFGQPIFMDEYKDQFLSAEEGAPRAAVKRLTAQIERELTEATINAPDWDTLYAARMARDLLWEDEKSINLDEFTIISQTLVDLFSTPDLIPNFTSIKRYLLTYYSLLQSTNLTNAVLASLPLPSTLNPQRPTPLPSRLLTLVILMRDSLSSLIRLPFFLFPLVVHMPAYIMGRMGARLVEDEEETQAQNKVVFGLLLLLMMYPAAFFFVWAFLRYTTVGAVIAVAFVFLFAVYHNKLVNDNYEHAKRLVAAWRVLVGVWAPKKWDLSLHHLAQYTTPQLPPENPWIDRSRTKSRGGTPAPSSVPSSPESPQLPLTPLAAASSTAASPVEGSPVHDRLSPTGTQDQQQPPAKRAKKRRPPTRRIIRHVLRARIEAAKSLASLFEQLDRSPEKKIRASSHLVRLYGGQLDHDYAEVQVDSGEGTATAFSVDEPVGWRSSKEVISFLRKRGAKIGGLERRVEGEWAAVSSEGDGDGDGTEVESESDIVWVPSQHS